MLSPPFPFAPPYTPPSSTPPLTPRQATGIIGSAIYQALLASPASFNITILTRPESKAKLPEGARVIRRAYDDPALVDALRGYDAVVSAISGMATLSQISLIDAAINAGVKKFMPAEVRFSFRPCQALAIQIGC